MVGLLHALFCLLFLGSLTRSTLGKWADDGGEEFFKRCPPSKCGESGPEIRYPLRLQSSPLSCGVAGLELSCSGEDTTLTLPSGNYKVAAVDYQTGFITIRLGSLGTHCPIQNLISFNLTEITSTTVYSAEWYEFSLISCPRKFKPNENGILVGPISCLSAGDEDRLVYIAGNGESISKMPSECLMTSTRSGIPYVYYDDFFDDDNSKLKDELEIFERTLEGDLSWYSNFSFSGDSSYKSWCSKSPGYLRCYGDDKPSSTNICQTCESLGKGRRCGFSESRNQTMCFKTSPNLKLKIIIGTPIGGFILIATVALILYCIFRVAAKEKETRLKVERFLATYKAKKPTRYTYSDIKKITKRLKHKLGQGGFGSVYKGKLPSGIPVAVKMLEKSKGEGEEFINEVATIGRIHHVNVVRLLGFCSEGAHHALIYEYMPNESLEKIIFQKGEKKGHRLLSIEQLQEIAIGIARGIEYLHQGCNQRILHFDIKPHNILLDNDFVPKISDFGLAKLCSKEQSIVTMTAARGTMGYIAPEMYSRNFGTVSYKSDVYSFGMLMLELVSGRRNIEPAIDNQSEIYFPDWVYDRLISRQDLKLLTEVDGYEQEIIKKLLVVALWCIQWNPMDRPSMTKVVQMLMGNLQSLELPPKPVVSSSDQD